MQWRKAWPSYTPGFVRHLRTLCTLQRPRLRVSERSSRRTTAHMCSYVTHIVVLLDMYSRAGAIEESLLRSNRAFPIINYVKFRS